MAINAFNKKPLTNSADLNSEAEACRNIIAAQRRSNNETGDQRMNAILDI